jgi:hypothetical protein
LKLLLFCGHVGVGKLGRHHLAATR